jgi:hypothetical protein
MGKNTTVQTDPVKLKKWKKKRRRKEKEKKLYRLM